MKEAAQLQVDVISLSFDIKLQRVLWRKQKQIFSSRIVLCGSVDLCGSLWICVDLCGSLWNSNIKGGNVEHQLLLLIEVCKISDYIQSESI